MTDTSTPRGLADTLSWLQASVERGFSGMHSHTSTYAVTGVCDNVSAVRVFITCPSLRDAWLETAAHTNRIPPKPGSDAHYHVHRIRP